MAARLPNLDPDNPLVNDHDPGRLLVTLQCKDDDAQCVLQGNGAMKYLTFWMNRETRPTRSSRLWRELPCSVLTATRNRQQMCALRIKGSAVVSAAIYALTIRECVTCSEFLQPISESLRHRMSSRASA